jgi:hypothetical protein
MFWKFLWVSDISLISLDHMSVLQVNDSEQSLVLISFVHFGFQSGERDKG